MDFPQNGHDLATYNTIVTLCRPKRWCWSKKQTYKILHSSSLWSSSRGVSSSSANAKVCQMQSFVDIDMAQAITLFKKYWQGIVFRTNTFINILSALCVSLPAVDDASARTNMENNGKDFFHFIAIWSSAIRNKCFLLACLLTAATSCFLTFL
jgi:hypothetical protein